MPEGGRRPADVLGSRPGNLLSRLPDGTRPHRQLPLAFDVAVVNALGDRHWRATASSPGAASAAYAATKRQHLDTANKCSAAGLHFQPLVFEAQGGMCSETAAVLHGVAVAAADGLGRDALSVKQELLSKIAVILARAAANSIHRRRRPAARRDVAPVLQLLQAERFCTEPPDGA